MLAASREPMALWQAFRAEFAKALSAVETSRILQAWTDQIGPRTRLYVDILRTVASSLELEHRTEVLRVDHVLCDPTSHVPLVFLESENNVFQAWQEVWKLCSVSAPLRLLLTVVEWDDKPGIWPAPIRRGELLAKWREIAVAQERVWPNPGLLAILVGERWRDRLRFYAHSFAAQAGEWQDDGVAFERDLAQ